MAFCAWCGNHVTEVSYASCPRCGNPTNGSPRVAGGDSSRNVGIILGVVFGGLFVIAVVGVIAAIAIPNFLTAAERSRQKRSMADIRSIARAVETHAVERNSYPAELSSLEVPAVDGWGTAFRYECWPRGECRSYAIGSAGRDKIFEYESLQEYPPGVKTTDFDNDIVFSDGQFLQYPEGQQKP